MDNRESLEHIVCTPSEYYVKQNLEYPYSDSAIFNVERMDECDLISQILALEAAYYSLRRTLYGSDFLTPIYNLRVSLVLEYKNKYKKEYVELNPNWHH